MLVGRSLEAGVCSYRQNLVTASFGRPEKLCDGNWPWGTTQRWIYYTPYAHSYNGTHIQKISCSAVLAGNIWPTRPWRVILMKRPRPVPWKHNSESGPSSLKLTCFQLTSSKLLSSFLKAAKRRKRHKIRRRVYWHILKNEKNKKYNSRDAEKSPEQRLWRKLGLATSPVCHQNVQSFISCCLG